MSAYNFVRSERNFTKIFLFNAPYYRYLHRFQRYLRSNSKVVVNRADFCTFFGLLNFKGGACPQKLYLR